jgi:hypothetical protein
MIAKCVQLSILLIVIFFLTACGSGRDDVLFIETHTSIIKVGERIPLRVQATEVLTGTPEWEVVELDGGSLIRSAGSQVTYIAPLTAGRYHVAVKATLSNGQTARVVQRIIVQPQLEIVPASVKVPTGETFAFKLNLRGVDLQKIRWSIDEPDGGSITSAGLYTAPTRPGFYTVVATAMTEGQPSAFATVQVE